MFRKPKNKANKAKFRKRSSKTNDSDDDDNNNSQLKKKRNIRSRNDSDSDDDDEDATNTTQVLQQLKREAATQVGIKKNNMIGSSSTSQKKKKNKVMHQYDVVDSQMSAQDVATRQAEYHPTNLTQTKSQQLEQNATSTNTDNKKNKNNPKSTSDNKSNETNTTEKIYKGQTKTVNKFHAGPLRAAANIRTTCRFDYQPDICKDYKETGFCGFGDSCIYLHVRGDSKTGWQLEQEWEEKRKREQEEKEREMDQFCQDVGGEARSSKFRKGGEKEEQPMDDDGIPFACFLCRKAFVDPIVTTCGHYFCQSCILQTLKDNQTSSTSASTSSACPICSKDTMGVFNFPTKLISKKKRLIGSHATWEEYKTYCEKRASK